MGVRADVERLHDMPRVCVTDLTMTEPDVARLVLAPTTRDDLHASDTDIVEFEFLIAINESEYGFALLRQWREHQSVLGVVIPPESRIIRLRSLDDLQPLTLRRLDS